MRTVMTVPKLAVLSLVVVFRCGTFATDVRRVPNYGTLRKSTMTGKLPMGIGKSQKGSTMLTRGGQALNTLSLVKRIGITTRLRRKFDWIITIGRVLFFAPQSEMEYYVYYLNVPNNKT